MLGRDLVGPQQMDAGTAAQPFGGPEVGEEMLGLVPCLVLVAGDDVGDHGEIDGHPSSAPHLPGSEHVLDHPAVALLAGLDEQHRIVTGDPEAPQTRLPEMVRGHLGRLGPEPGFGCENRRQELLELGQVVGLDTESACLPCRGSVGIGYQPLERRERVIAGRRVGHHGPRRPDDRGEGELLGRERRQLDCGAQGHDRVEGVPVGAGQALLDTAGPFGAAIAAQEALTVGFEARSGNRR